MKTVSINILNPNALDLLENLAKLKLISIQTTEQKRKEKSLMDVIQNFRSGITEEPLSLEEITAEVEIVRAERYAANQ
jgi:hypothetical protein